MLTITPTAADALTARRIEAGAPAGFGVRFFASQPTGSGRTRLAFKFVESPGADDKIISEGGLDAYVAPDVERLMGDIVVDAEQTGAGLDLVVRRTPQQD